ncbi:SNF2 family DNA or RNA helicase [Parabacteroides sp. PF5-5]|uniref:DEAD/DEAH box helicase n=1 Tax=unclassified Parabacteroides TaxID=2649774 RepID=UPI0024732A44|nr:MULTISPECIES: DEAD/DEAH box helicase [unclassified Parabacteroides]MDH6303887.1 SNF2 family DNA or RNA helicase [Parabacteroides sp. PH5-39]MDH6314504.1 SNF2 family DNA or RNA helicase [Parabacteroides sp. PF5-13]MDH6318431.1 SNF2 family DNA or RNA helicase [Parabacteroides sp. PH5-13]MDH6322276.1 SNF2 family DNA or RNA helicase [Parabacteroides sp. PH5-8]MDH6325644.1 SNF2 family DNA or RNA helicase [Parabacteroides sp. PH5-41]
MEDERLILVLSEHRIFGWKLNIHSARLNESGSVQILGTPVAKQEEERGAPAAIVQIIRRADEMSDKALMKTFSKKKSLREFEKEVTEEMYEKYIRPRIELGNRKIVELAKQTDLPVFFREKLSSNILYDWHRIHILPMPAECLFNFVKDENSFRYFISLTVDGQEISLQTKPAIIISHKPATVLIGSKIYCVENIDSKKLIPFFTKDFVLVPPASEEVYLKNFVLKTMQEFKVKIQGIPVKEIKPSKQAYLSLEEDLNQEYVLVLSFLYESLKIYPDNRKKKIIWLEGEGSSPAICWYERDLAWENQMINILKQEGLQAKGINHYYTGDTQNQYSLIEWLNKKEKVLNQNFILGQILGQNFFTGELYIQSDVDNKIDWFEVNIEVIIGEHKIPFSRFRKQILKGSKEFLLPDKTIAILPDEWFERYQELFRFGKEENAVLRVEKIHTPVLGHALAGQVSRAKLDEINSFLKVPIVHPPLPEQPAVELRSYQKDGFYWLAHLYEHGYGGCLADDMGLGKTLQTITLLKYIYGKSEQSQAVRSDGQLSLFESSVSVLPPVLIVAPTSLLHNWKNELKRFAPELNVWVYAGYDRQRTKDQTGMFDNYQVIITSYGIMRNDIEYLRNYAFQMVILDESQYIKNTDSLVYQSVKQLVSEHKLVLTGTPIENSLEDLWAQFNFINEGLLGSLSSFKKDFVHKIVKEKNTGQEDRLKKIIQPFLLRRTKEEVTPELPPLLQEVVYCDMTDAQQKAYENEKNRIRNMLLEAWEHPELPKNNLVALEGLNKLRQLSCHPRLVIPDYEESSGKFEQVIMSFENLKASHHKVLIFSSYVRHLNLLAEKFNEEGWPYAMLTGETTKREEEIKRFTENKDINCFFISLKAGSTGLNLTAADYVFIIDPWWNPAAEMQALSRAHRIGQDKPVIAYRFVSSETIEEKIIRLQESKAALSETFINSNNPLSLLNRNDMEELLK